MGILCSYLIKKHPGAFSDRRWVRLLLWTVSCLTTYAMMVWTNCLWLWDYKLGYYEVLVYLLTSKIFHLAGWFWLTYICATRPGGEPYFVAMVNESNGNLPVGLVNKVLGWSGFTSFANLSFEVMLVSDDPCCIFPEPANPYFI